MSTTEKLDKKSKEILEQLVDNKIVPPLEDRLWKHVPQEDIVPGKYLKIQNFFNTAVNCYISTVLILFSYLLISKNAKFVAAPESDSDHEPSSTVTIPTPPRSQESDEFSSSQMSNETKNSCKF